MTNLVETSITFEEAQNKFPWEFAKQFNPFNVADEFKGLDNQKISEILYKRSYPLWIVSINWNHDINFGGMVRSANAFGARGVIQVSDNRRWDRRGAVGVHHYTPVTHAHDTQDVIDWAKEMNATMVALENNLLFPTIKLSSHTWNPTTPTVIFFGSEGMGVPEDVLRQMDTIVSIPQRGSVRSLNVSSVASIVMYDYQTKCEALS